MALRKTAMGYRPQTPLYCDTEAEAEQVIRDHEAMQILRDNAYDPENGVAGFTVCPTDIDPRSGRWYAGTEYHGGSYRDDPAEAILAAAKLEDER